MTIYIEFGSSRWSALNMGFVDKWPSITQERIFIYLKKGQGMQHLLVKIKKTKYKISYFGGAALGCQIAGPGLETPFTPWWGHESAGWDPSKWHDPSTIPWVEMLEGKSPHNLNVLSRWDLLVGRSCIMRISLVSLEIPYGVWVHCNPFTTQSIK